MTGKNVFVIFLIAGVLLAGSASAEGNPDAGLGSQDSGQVSGQNEMTIRSEVPLSEPANGATSDKGAAPKTEAVSEAGVPRKAEAAPEEAEAVEAAEETTIADPIEPWNRAMFQFNDKLYFWALKPVARGYNAVVPEPARISVRSFFRNVAMPVRFVNSLFQGKFKAAGTELARFGINTTIGMVGFFDVAKSRFDLEAHNEDLGQTLGHYGMGGLMYIVWPFIGPSNVRDTIGFAGDSFLDPVSYIDPFEAAIGVNAYGQINKTSLELGTYEDMVESALEPYIAVRDAYIQYRNGLIKK
ncbi:MAG: VacJ family lipoprotein [Geobacteraceae bacterium]|jgi:phospholipid-binding lipoprotein MlaA